MDGAPRRGGKGARAGPGTAGAGFPESSDKSNFRALGPGRSLGVRVNRLGGRALARHRRTGLPARCRHPLYLGTTGVPRQTDHQRDARSVGAGAPATRIAVDC